MRPILLALAFALAAGPAHAQYYGAPPPPPPYVGPSYGGPPPYGAPPPGYYPRREYAPDIGSHCVARLQTPYGPRRLFCRIVDPKPVGEPCACPPPPPPPGYEPGPFVGGRTVR